MSDEYPPGFERKNDPSGEMPPERQEMTSQPPAESQPPVAPPSPGDAAQPLPSGPQPPGMPPSDDAPPPLPPGGFVTPGIGGSQAPGYPPPQSYPPPGHAPAGHPYPPPAGQAAGYPPPPGYGYPPPPGYPGGYGMPPQPTYRPKPRRVSPPVTFAGVSSWCLVIMAIAGMTFLQQLGVFALKDAQLDTARDTIGSQLVLLGRYAVGIKETLGKAGGSQFQKTGEDLLKQVDGTAISPKEHIAVVSVIGEMDGPEAALNRIDDLLLPQTGDFSMALSFDQQRDLQTLRTVYTDDAENPVSDADAERLLKRYGWFGELAMSWNQGNAEPQRRGVLNDAKIVAVLLISIFAGGLTAAVIGLVLLIVGIVLVASQRMVPAFANNLPVAADHTRPLLETFFLFIMAMVSYSLFAEFMAWHFNVHVSDWFIWLIPCVLIWPLLRGMTWPEMRRRLGLHLGKGVLIEIGCGVLGYLAGLPLLLIAIAFVVAASMIFDDSSMHARFQHMAEQPHFITLAVLVMIWAPLVEEIFFRGALYHHMRRRYPAVAVILITAFIFAIIHPYVWFALPLIFALGITLAAIREWRGSLIASMTAHAIQNTMAFTVMYFSLS